MGVRLKLGKGLWVSFPSSRRSKKDEGGCFTAIIGLAIVGLVIYGLIKLLE